MVKKSKIINFLFLISILILIINSSNRIVFAELLTGNTTIKKGVGYTGGTVEQLHALGAGWGYRWYTEPQDFNLSGYQYVPMIFNNSFSRTNIAQTAENHPGSYWLVFNEPDRNEQGHLTPTQAANLYWEIRELVLPIDPTAKFIVGGVYNVNTSWLTEFRQAYKDLSQNTSHIFPPIDGWHVHYYIGMADNYSLTKWQYEVSGIKRWMDSIGESKPVWLTEFGCLNCWTTAGTQKMKLIMQDQIPWLENQSWIARYAWFATKTLPDYTGELLMENSLTDIGEIYASLGVNCPQANLGNLDCDSAGKINMTDLTILLNHWGESNSLSSLGDLSGINGPDGIINMIDLTYLLGHWRN